MTEKDYDSCILMRCNVPAMSLLFGVRRITFAGDTVYLEDTMSVPEAAPSVLRNTLYTDQQHKTARLFECIAVICVTKSRTGDYDFRACARARGFRGSTFSVGRIRFAVCAERSRDKTCVF